MLLLITIGLPAIINLPSYFYSSSTEPMQFIVFWAGYALFVWLFIFLNVGIRTLLSMLSGAFVLAMTTAMLGAGLRKVFPILQGSASASLIDIKMATLFFVMISVIPYGLMFVSSFSARGVLDGMSRRNNMKEFGLHIALGLRVIQHVGEVFIKLLTVWHEEHPNFLLPRNRKDWEGKWYSKTGLIPWLLESFKSWIYACMMHAFEPIPVLVNEIQRTATNDERKTK